MSEHTARLEFENRDDDMAGRRRQLRALLLSAANAARQGRRVQSVASRMARPMGQAVRERVAMLLSATG